LHPLERDVLDAMEIGSRSSMPRTGLLILFIILYTNVQNGGIT
jgi:hypothetical protein